MIQMETLLRVMDNSGGILAKCIKVYGKRLGVIGDKILVSLRRMRFKRKSRLINKPNVENHQMYKALVVQMKRGFSRKDGRILVFNKNKIVLFSRSQEKFIGTRILGLVAKEFRNKKYLKLLTVSSRSV